MKIKSFLNSYYLDIISDMELIISSSTAGSRSWRPSSDINRIYDYEVIHSTFPQWIKFWYVKTPKKKQSEYAYKAPYLDGYWNGNTKELLTMFRYLKKGKRFRSERKALAFEKMVSAYLSDTKDSL